MTFILCICFIITLCFLFGYVLFNATFYFAYSSQYFLPFVNYINCVVCCCLVVTNCKYYLLTYLSIRGRESEIYF